MFLFLLACTTPDDDTTTDDIEVEPVPCGDGFGRADDGNCYPVDADPDTGASSWAFSEAPCEGEESYYLTLQTGGPTVAAWGAFTPEAIELCEGASEDWCSGVAEGAEGAPAELYASDETAALLRCEWFDLRSSEGDEWRGFQLSPLRAYFLVD
ncbi:MAG: hypothetical protein L0221_15835 [Chloroflexi bacterium]|nr:hypothetical protein [Chloroflexota bacterium]